MKNMKKLVSLLLAVCLMASLAIGASAAEPTTVDVSGGTGTSSVNLSSTSDGTLDGDPAATKMNVTIPTILPIAVGVDGTVTTATDIRITNNSFGAVKVDNVKVEAGTGWKLTAFGSKIERAKLDVELPAGEYECTAYFSNLDPDSGATLGVAGAIIHITIQN